MVRKGCFLQFIMDVLGNSMKLEGAQLMKQALPAASNLRAIVDPCFQTQKTFSFCALFCLQQGVCFSANTQGMGKFIPLWSNASCEV